LSRRGYQLGVASNYDQRLRRVVAGLPPLRLLSLLVISSEVGWRKPAAGFFDALIRGVDLPAGQILLVGDDWNNDYEGARAAGLQAVLFDPGDKAASTPAMRIRRLVELLPRLGVH
jgi:putative hydrolase of the HAD superfamily